VSAMLLALYITVRGAWMPPRTSSSSRATPIQPVDANRPPGYHAELGHRAPERLAVEYKRCFDAHDLDGVRDLQAEAFVMVDRRERNSQGAEEEWRPEYGSSDVRIEMEEVLACDERVIAMCATVRGTSPDGQQFEVPLGSWTLPRTACS